MRSRFLALRVRPANIELRKAAHAVDGELDHFEGRSRRGWHHHVTLVSVAHGFLTIERLRRPQHRAAA